MLFQHDPSEPVGIWLELHEDLRGLYARGQLIPDVARARELLALVKAGAVDGLSIGFRTVSGRDRSADAASAGSYQVDLWEISIVTFPLLDGARVRAVKEAAPSLSRLRGRALSRNGARSGGRGRSVPRVPRGTPRFTTARAHERREHALRGVARTARSLSAA